MIEASTVKISTMSDDTLRIVLDISPAHAQEAFALFGARGSPVVIARLTQEAATASARADTVSRVESEKPRGGDLARLAGQFCANPEFWDFVASEKGLCPDNVGAAEATEYVRFACGVKSRAEIDHNATAALIFHEDIRKPFAAWCRARGVA